LLLLEKTPKKTEHLLVRADALFNIFNILLIANSIKKSIFCYLAKQPR
jgi:hypothetical protein